MDNAICISVGDKVIYLSAFNGCRYVGEVVAIDNGYVSVRWGTRIERVAVSRVIKRTATDHGAFRALGVVKP